MSWSVPSRCRLTPLRSKISAGRAIFSRLRSSSSPIDYYVGTPEDTAAYILTLDAINFGSGYFPYLAKRPGHSGYFTIASSLRENWESEGPWDARPARSNVRRRLCTGDAIRTRLFAKSLN